jgi:hypothetical protein
MDPTGTTQLRSRFRADAHRQLGKLRSLAYQQLVEKDALNPLNNIFTQGPHRKDGTIVAFNEWFKHTASMSLLENGWWHRHLHRAYGSGLDRATKMLQVSSKPLDYSTDPPQKYIQMAQTDLEGISAALAQNVTRRLTMGPQKHQKPLNNYRQVLEQVKKIGTQRLSIFANVHTVLAHNAGRLSVFRAAGIGAVGVVPETIPALRSPSSRTQARDHFHPHVHDAPIDPDEYDEDDRFDILTAGDDKVCWECEAISQAGPYELDFAEALIPAHINCRCSIVPFGEYTPEELLGED